MSKKKIEILIIGFMLCFSYFQCIYIINSNKEEIIEQQNLMTSYPEEDLPSLEWERKWQTASIDDGNALCLDSLENVHVAGITGSYNNYDFLYLKYNKEGLLQDSMTWSLYPDNNIARDIIVDSSDNIYITGYVDIDTSSGFSDVNYNTYVAKFSNSGVPDWNHIWGGSENDDARTIALDASGNVYIGGLTKSYGEGSSDALLIKYSSGGIFQWYQPIGGIDTEWVNSMVYDSVDSFYLCGGFKLNGTNNNDLYLVKVDQNGVQQWDRTWDVDEIDIGLSVALDPVGDVYVLGYTTDYAYTYQNAFLIKYNSKGDLLWDITLSEEYFMDPGGLTIDKFGDIYITGGLYNFSDSKYYSFLMKLDNLGNQIWNITNDAIVDLEYLGDLKITNSGNIYATGFGYNSGGVDDVYTKKFTYELTDVKLITPENKTYTEPMNGYYPATYGFENDPNERFPYDWIPSSNGGTCQVIQTLEDHNKVVELYDSSVPGDIIGLTNNFSSKQQEGAVEFYFRSTDANKQTDIYLYENSTSDGILLTVKSNNLWYYKDMTYNELGTPIQNNSWYHFLIEFNSTSDTFKLWVNGNNIVYIGDEFPYQTDNTGMTHLNLTTNNNYEDYFSYFDAIGYSWDPKYNIGDNLMEGLLIDYVMPPNIDWQAFSLDEQENISTSGSIVIPFLEDGQYTIQISGNTTNGDLFQSEKRFFAVDTKFPEIIINSPEENSIFEGIPPIYNLTIIEDNIVSVWYTIDRGIRNVTISELNDYIDFDIWIGTSDGEITIEFYIEDIAGNIANDTVTIIKEITNSIFIELVDLACTKDKFDFIFNIHDEHDIGINFANINLFWDGVDFSSNIQNLGNGIYFISLEPILVAPGDDPILLTMMVSASGFDEVYFEIKVAIDPETITKGQEYVFPVEMMIIVFSTISGGALIGIITYNYFKKRK